MPNICGKRYRPDLASAVGILSKYMSRPSDEHWKGAKRVLKYIKGTTTTAWYLMAEAQDVL